MPGDKTNVIVWRETLLKFARYRFGRNGDVINDLADHVFEDIDYDEDAELTRVIDPFGLNKAALVARIRERARRVASYEETKVNIL